MDDGHTEDPGEPFVDEPPPWTGQGAVRGPRPPAEGVRIIGAEEAAAALEAGHASPRVPEDAPRFGDVPDTPPGPRPPLRFPGADPAAVAKPPVIDPPPTAPPPPPPPPEPVATAPPPPEDFWDAPAPDRPPTPRAGRFEELVARDASSDPAGDPDQGAEVDWNEAPSWGRMPGAAAAPVPVTSAAEIEEPSVSPSWSPSDPRSEGRSGPYPRSEGRSGPGPRSEGRSGPGPRSEGRSGPGPDPGAVPAAEPGGSPTRAWDLFDDPVVRASGQVPLVEAGDPPDVAGVPLPHWTEPPSGEHPRILPDSEPPGLPPDDLGPWSSLSAAPRWRDSPTDWESADFQEGMLDDRESRMGALRDPPASEDDDGDELFGFEEPAPAPPARGGATQVRSRAPRPPAEDPPPGPPAGGRDARRGDVTTRVVTGAIAAAVLLVAAKIGPGALVLLVAAAVVLATAELLQALRTRGYQPATLLGLVASAAMVGGVYWRGEQAFPLILTLLVVFSLLWYLVGVVKGRPTMNVAVTVLAFLYVGFLGSFAALLLKFPFDHGIGLLLGAVLATVAFDIGSFFAGRSMGKTLLAPEISPNKTVEGLVGGCALTLVVCLAIVGSIEPWDVGRAFWLFVVVCPAALLGDLCESMIKRDLGVKDMGTILPGHGGVLDRIDALLFVIPATYYLVRLLNFF